MGLFDFLKGSQDVSSLPKEEQYGLAWRMIVGVHRRNEGLTLLQKLAKDGFAEASVALAMFTENPAERKALILQAAEQNHPEGLWQLCQFLPHGYYPDAEDEKDKLWMDTCLAAAEAGSVDAMNEMGNICHRLENYAESMYWYAMANFNDQADGQLSMQSIAREWEEAGLPREFVEGTPKFTKARFRTAMVYLDMYTGQEISVPIQEIMHYNLEGEPLSGYLLGDIFEQSENYEMAYKMYNALSFTNDGHGLKSYADMLCTGRGVARDPSGAQRMYQLAAENGDRGAMFATAEFLKASNKNLAAYWYGVSHTRGFPLSLDCLVKLAK